MRALSHFGNERLAVWSFRSGRALSDGAKMPNECRTWVSTTSEADRILTKSNDLCRSLCRIAILAGLLQGLAQGLLVSVISSLEQQVNSVGRVCEARRGSQRLT